MSHTPGQWVIWDKERELNPEFSTGLPMIVAPPSSTKYVETVDIATIHDDTDEYIANAHLVAAAPELLEALKQLEYLAPEKFDDDEHETNWNSSIRNIRKVISKAEGKI